MPTINSHTQSNSLLHDISLPHALDNLKNDLKESANAAAAEPITALHDAATAAQAALAKGLPTADAMEKRLVRLAGNLQPGLRIKALAALYSLPRIKSLIRTTEIKHPFYELKSGPSFACENLTMDDVKAMARSFGLQGDGSKQEAGQIKEIIAGFQDKIRQFHWGVQKNPCRHSSATHDALSAKDYQEKLGLTKEQADVLVQSGLHHGLAISKEPDANGRFGVRYYGKGSESKSPDDHLNLVSTAKKEEGSLVTEVIKISDVLADIFDPKKDEQRKAEGKPLLKMDLFCFHSLGFLVELTKLRTEKKIGIKNMAPLIGFDAYLNTHANVLKALADSKDEEQDAMTRVQEPHGFIVTLDHIDEDKRTKGCTEIMCDPNNAQPFVHPGVSRGNIKVGDESTHGWKLKKGMDPTKRENWEKVEGKLTPDWVGYHLRKENMRALEEAVDILMAVVDDVMKQADTGLSNRAA